MQQAPCARRLPRLRPDDGQTLIELAAGLTVLFMILLAIFKFGLAYYHKVSLNDAVRVAARTASICRTALAGSTNAQTAGDNAANGLTITWTIKDTSRSGASFASVPCTVVQQGDTLTVTGTHPESISILGVYSINPTLSSTETVIAE